MEWTQETTLYLIEMYREKELLWDAKHPWYYNKIKKSDAWTEIASEMNISTEECKKKMNAILSALRRERAKITKSIVAGAGK